MKILFISSSFYPQVGGVEKHTLAIAQELVRRGHSITVITEQKKDYRSNTNPNYHSSNSSDNEAANKKSLDKSTFFEYNKLDHINIYYVKFGQSGWLKKFRIWYLLWKLRHLINDADVIHCHDVFVWYLPFRFIYFFKKVFVTFHGYETVFPPTTKAKIIRKVSEKLTKGNICVGSYIQQWYGTHPTYVVYGGVDKDTLRFHSTRSAKSPFVITFIGRLEKDTGGEAYVKVLDTLKKNNVRYSFNAYGDGSLRKLFEKYGIVHGFIADVSSNIKQADIVFASSYLSIIEALGAQKFVVSTYENPLKYDYLTQTPFKDYIIVSNDPENIAKQMVQYLTNPQERNTTVKKAYEWVKKQTWESVTETYIKLWRTE